VISGWLPPQPRYPRAHRTLRLRNQRPGHLLPVARPEVSCRTEPRGRRLAI